MWDDLATDGQVSYIYRLVERRAVTRRTAERIIQLLEDCPILGDNGLDFTHIRTEINEQRHQAGRGDQGGSTDQPDPG